MAGLEQRNGNWNIIIRFGGKRFIRSLKTKSETDAEAARVRVEENIRLIHRGRLHLPNDADIPTFLLSDGQLIAQPVANGALTLSSFFAEFFHALPDGSHEETTLGGMQIHRRHLERILGKRFSPQALTKEDLQRYVNTRAKERGQRGKVGANTIKKELVTLGTVWRWASDKYGLGEFPRRGLHLPKETELPRFQTWKEIERQVGDDPESELWDCLYLTIPEIEQLLTFVKDEAAYPFIHPMVTFAAYTGTRRSELLRSQLTDIDIDAKVVTIREKKRKRGQITTRRVPLVPPLLRVLRPWLTVHPGPYTFCQIGMVGRSRKTRQRLADTISLTRDEAHHYFKHTLSESKWQVIKGWHCLRHSFVANCVSRGVDQRMVDEWVGHTTESTRRRYRHLLPDSQQDAIKTVFR